MKAGTFSLMRISLKTQGRFHDVRLRSQALIKRISTSSTFLQVSVREDFLQIKLYFLSQLIPWGTLSLTSVKAHQQRLAGRSFWHELCSRKALRNVYTLTQLRKEEDQTCWMRLWTPWMTFRRSKSSPCIILTLGTRYEKKRKWAK